jgi:hypothetical protein
MHQNQAGYYSRHQVLEMPDNRTAQGVSKGGCQPHDQKSPQSKSSQRQICSKYATYGIAELKKGWEIRN